MTIKKIISQLDNLMQEKFPHFIGRFYSNRRNNYIHFRNKERSAGRGKFLKICKDTLYAKYW